MGCDIHLHVEVKLNGKWEHYNHPYISRDYRLFARMAGVCRYDDEIEPVSPPRGLPEDISVTTRFDADNRWGEDGHSHSWLSAAEAGLVQEWYGDLAQEKFPHPPVFGYVFGNYVDSCVKYPHEKPKGLEDVRVVFWFDN